jgi:hypothetical protein
VAINRVPIFIPQAPIARLAANCLPSAQPPLARKGMPSFLAAWHCHLGSSIIVTVPLGKGCRAVTGGKCDLGEENPVAHVILPRVPPAVEAIHGDHIHLERGSGGATSRTHQFHPDSAVPKIERTTNEHGGTHPNFLCGEGMSDRGTLMNHLRCIGLFRLVQG